MQASLVRLRYLSLGKKARRGTALPDAKGKCIKRYPY